MRARPQILFYIITAVLMFLFTVVLLHADTLPLSKKITPLKVYSCIIHVHSKISEYGRYSLKEMSQIAQHYGVDAIFLSDNLTDTIQYGLWPFRHVFWINYYRKSVWEYGPEKYLEMIDIENKRQSDILYIPGLEVCPRFYWTDCFSGTDGLSCNNHQRNIIVMGTDNVHAIKNIPEVCGYVWGKDTIWIILTRLMVLLLILAFLITLVMPGIFAKYSEYTKNEIRNTFLRGIILPLFLIVIFINVSASFIKNFNIYGKDSSLNYEQRMINFLEKNNLVHYWAHPEASDLHHFKCLGIKFKARTFPYPELLLKTKGYSGFGGVYEAKNTITDPGSIWDKVLMEYINGYRKKPIWCFGEMLYHYEGQAGKMLGNVETMVRASEKTEKALLGSIRTGNFYARINKGEQCLILDKWEVEKTEDLKAKIDISISARLTEEIIRIQLIKNGKIIQDRSESTPLNITLYDELKEDVKSYYRILVTGRGQLKLVSNPIFIFLENH